MRNSLVIVSILCALLRVTHGGCFNYASVGLKPSNVDELRATTIPQVITMNGHSHSWACAWRITTPNQNIKLFIKIVTFNTESTFDFLFVTDGKNFVGALHGALPNGPTFLSNTSSVQLLYVTDGSIDSIGFSLQYRIATSTDISTLAPSPCSSFSTKCSPPQKTAVSLYGDQSSSFSACPCNTNGLLTCDSCTHGVCNLRGASYTCICNPAYTGSKCNQDVNECLNNPCMNNATCLNLINDFSCSCLPGYTGKNCSQDIDECLSLPCQNGGSCTNLINNYSCSCVPGFTGRNCESDIDECLTNPCENNATCSNLNNDFSCSCLPGYTGKNCSQDIDECLSLPCQNGGNCTNLINNHSCSCVPGFTGRNCESDIDECLNNPCENNASCTNLLNDFGCTCLAGYTGKNCSQDIDECLGNPCENNASCTNLLNDFNCSCLAGFSGKNCSQNIDECIGNPCRNGGTCYDHINRYSCSCVPGYDGKNCTTPTGSCVKCPPFSTCVLSGNDSITFQCICNSGFEKSLDGTLCLPFCQAENVTKGGEVFSFQRTSAEQRAMSYQTCSSGTGRPKASALCSVVGKDGSKANFSSINVVSCELTLNNLPKKGENITSESVSNVINNIDVLSSGNQTLSSTDTTSIVNALDSISSSNLSAIAISQDTVKSTLAIINQVSTSIQKNTVTSKQDENQKKKLVAVIQNFANHVTLPANQTQLTIITKDITVQVNRPEKNGTTYNDVLFSHKTDSIDVILPGSVMKEASKQNSEPRVSFVYHTSAALFPKVSQGAKIGAVISANVKSYNPSTVTQPVSVTFSNVTDKQGEVPLSKTLTSVVTRTTCVTSDSTNGAWTRQNCHHVNTDNGVRCVCHAFASYAMIVDTQVLPSAFEMAIYSYISCAISSLALLATIIIYLSIRSLRSRKTTIFLVNICICLFASNIAFLAGSGRISYFEQCYFAAAIIQYFLLAAWFWMSANAYNMYHFLVKVVSVSTFIPKLSMALCYFLPLLIVCINIGIGLGNDMQTYYPDDNLFQSAYKARHICWLHNYSLYFGFLLPVFILFVANVFFFTIVFINITCKRVQVQSSMDTRKKRHDLVAAVTMAVMMGLTWVFGFFMVTTVDPTALQILAWLFTIFNTAQGLMIFIISCLRQEAARNAWLDPLIAFITCKEPPIPTTTTLLTPRHSANTTTTTSTTKI